MLHLHPRNETQILRAAPPHGRASTAATPIYQLNVDRRLLSETQETMGMYHRYQEPVTASGCTQYVEPTIGLFFILLAICTNPELGRTPPPDDAPWTEDDVSHFITMTKADGSSVTMNKIDMFRETIYGVDGTIRAYRFTWIVYDPQFSMNRAVDALIKQNAAYKLKKGEEDLRTDWQKMVHKITKRQHFVQGILQYVDSTLRVTSAKYHHPLGHTEGVSLALRMHPSVAHAALMGMFPQQILGEDNVYRPNILALQPQFYDYVNIVREITPPRAGDPMRLDFYFMEAIQFEPDEQHPNVQADMLLFVNAASREWQRNLSKRQIEHKLYEAACAITRNVSKRKDADKDQMDEVRDINLAQLKGKTPEEQCALRNGPDFMDRFKPLTFVGADISPGVRAVFNWFNKEISIAAAEGRTYVIYDPGATIVDPTLDWTANMLALRMLELEALEGISAVHEEVLMCQLIRCSAYEKVDALHINMLMTGPATSGKSFVLDMLKKLSIPGTYEVPAIVTARGDAVDVDSNGLVRLRDEMPPTFFDPKADMEEEKERLTSCRVEVQQCKVDKETGKRAKQTSVGYFQTCMIGCSNQSIEGVDKALLTRYHVRCVPIYPERPGHDAVTHMAKEHEANIAPKDKNRREQFRLRLQQFQFLSCVIYSMMYLEMMKAPDLSVVFAYFVLYKKELQARGVQVEVRHMVRLWRFAQVLTIWTAIHIVFFTPTLGWDEGHRFCFEDVLKCQPFMFATEQIAVFAITMLGDMFVHPQLDFIIKAVAKGCNYAGLNAPAPFAGMQGPKWHRAPRTMGGPLEDDQNYLEINLTLVEKGTSLIQAAAKIIHRSLDTRGLLVSPEMIHDVLTGLIGQKKRVRPWVPPVEGQTPQRAEEQDMLIVEMSDSLRYFKILRHYVDEAIARAEKQRNENGVQGSLVLEAIKATWHKKTPSRRLMLGCAWRDATVADMFPQLFPVIMSEPNKARTMIIANPGAMDINLWLTMYPLDGKTGNEAAYKAAGYLKIDGDEDLENSLFNYYYERLGMKKDNPLFKAAWPTNRRRGPEKFLNKHEPTYPKLHREEISKQTDKSQAVGLSTATWAGSRSAPHEEESIFESSLNESAEEEHIQDPAALASQQDLAMADFMEEE